MAIGTLLVYFCAAVFGNTSNAGVTSENVDLIELNHFYDQHGRHVYDQVIFFEQAPASGKLHVRAWCLVEDRESLSRRPSYNLQNQTYQVDWYDTDQKILRRITSRVFRESWTQVDPERSDKRSLDERLRISLVQSPQRLRAERQLLEESQSQAEAQATQRAANEPADSLGSMHLVIASQNARPR